MVWRQDCRRAAAMFLLLLKSLALTLFDFSWKLVRLTNVVVAGVCGQFFSGILCHFRGLLVVVVNALKQILVGVIVVEFADGILLGCLSIVFIEGPISGFMFNI